MSKIKTSIKNILLKACGVLGNTTSLLLIQFVSILKVGTLMDKIVLMFQREIIIKNKNKILGHGCFCLTTYTMI